MHADLLKRGDHVRLRWFEGGKLHQAEGVFEHVQYKDNKGETYINISGKNAGVYRASDVFEATHFR